MERETNSEHWSTEHYAAVHMEQDQKLAMNTWRRYWNGKKTTTVNNETTMSTTTTTSMMKLWREEKRRKKCHEEKFRCERVTARVFWKSIHLGWAKRSQLSQPTISMAVRFRCRRERQRERSGMEWNWWAKYNQPFLCIYCECVHV